jgi:hypothetical protein
MQKPDNASLISRARQRGRLQQRGATTARWLLSDSAQAYGALLLCLFCWQPAG